MLDENYVKLWRPLLVRRALALLGNQADAEDVAQQVLADLAAQFRNVHPYTLVRDRALRLVERRRAERHAEQVSAEEKAARATPERATVAGNAELEDWAARQAEKLDDPTDRAVLTLHLMEGRTQREVAAELGVTQPSVAKRKRKIKKKLREE